MSINWTKINDIIHRTLTYLSTTHPTYVNKLLDWYLSVEKEKMSVQQPEFRRWVIAGITPMKTITTILNREIEQLKGQKDKVKILAETIIEFLGCREQFNYWYLSLLKQYANLPQVNSNIPFFEEACLTNRQRSLKI